jgi:YHS domain-containing protein
MFFRLVLLLLIALLLLTLVRMFAGVLTKGVGGLFDSPKPGPGTKPPKSAAGGELKRDPVCGTFVPATSSVTKSVHGHLIHFCSPECRDKYKES